MPVPVRYTDRGLGYDLSPSALINNPRRLPFVAYMMAGFVKYFFGLGYVSQQPNSNIRYSETVEVLTDTPTVSLAVCGIPKQRLGRAIATQPCLYGREMCSSALVIFGPTRCATFWYR